MKENPVLSHFPQHKCLDDASPVITSAKVFFAKQRDFWLLNVEPSLKRLLSSKRIHSIIFISSLLVLCALSVWPIWQLTYLPFSDLPDHAAQMHVILNANEYADDYRINWFTPYLLAYSLALAFASICSIPIAIKIVLSLSIAAIPFACLSLIRATNGNRFWVWVVFPGVYSFSLFWGFFSYAVATPIAIYTLAFAVRYSSRDLSVSGVVCAISLSSLLFFSHAMAWAATIVLLPSIIWIYNPFRQAIRKTIPFIAIIPLVAYWLNHVGAANETAISDGHHLSHYLGRISQSIDLITNDFTKRNEEGKQGYRFMELFAFSIGKKAAPDYVLIALLLLIGPLFIGARLSREVKRWLPLTSAIGLFFIAPYWLFDTAYVYPRFAIFLFPAIFFLYVVRSTSIDQIERPWGKNFKLWAAYCFCFLLVSTLLNSTRLQLASFVEDEVNFKEVLSQMAPNKKVLSLIFDGESSLTFTPAYMHYGSWYQAEKGGVVLPSFSHQSNAANVPVRYLHKTWPVPDTWKPREFKWRKHQAKRYDYFLIRVDSVKIRRYWKHFDKTKLVIKAGKWHLFERLQEK